ncbi:MAG: hypothetical protein PVF87_09710 [Acidimicrobiia bacterium]|jgi:hypothetical protein
MRTIERLGTWKEVTEGRSREVIALAERLRSAIIELDSDVVEVPRAGEGSVAFGVGEKKMSEAYCYLMPQRDRVNLGFYHGVDVDDPEGLLEGTGARLRHVKVHPDGDDSSPTMDSLRALIVAARAERISALGGIVRRET